MKSKKKIFIAALIAILTIIIPVVGVSASSAGPEPGDYVITNMGNGLELRVSPNNEVRLHNPDTTVWRVNRSTNPYFYTITTPDGRLALTYNPVTDELFLSPPMSSSDTNRSRQHWLIRRATGEGFMIDSLHGQNLEPWDTPTLGDYALHARTTAATVPGYVDVDTRANNNQFIWRLTPPPAPSPTITPTITPTPTRAPDQQRMPVPRANFANGSVIRSNQRVQLMPPTQFPNARVVYTLINPHTTANVTWNPSTVQINTPTTGTLEIWARTERAGNRAESEIVHFVFTVERAPGGPGGPGGPNRPGGPPLNQVVLQVTMNQLRYTVNGVPHYFDVAPYLDTRANRSMIPMRFIAEAFGATVVWEDATRTQHIHLGGRHFTLTENVPLPDGMGTPVLVQNRFFVPLRYVSQELGASVTWDNATQTNTISFFR